MASRSHLSYESIQADSKRFGLMAKKKTTSQSQKRKIETQVTAQDLWENFEKSSNPAGDILDIVDRALAIAFGKLSPETDEDWPKVEKLLKFSFEKLPKAIRDLRTEIGLAIDQHMRAQVTSVTPAQMKEIDEEVKTAKIVLNYLIEVIKQLEVEVHDFLSQPRDDVEFAKGYIPLKEYRTLAKDISTAIRAVKGALREEIGKTYVLPKPLKLQSRSMTMKTKQVASKKGWTRMFRKK